MLQLDQAPVRQRTERMTARDLGVLVAFGLVWTAYLWLHVAGAIALFGRP